MSRTIEERYQWLVSRFRGCNLTMDGMNNFRFDHARLPRGRTVEEMIDNGIQQDIDDAEELAQAKKEAGR